MGSSEANRTTTVRENTQRDPFASDAIQRLVAQAEGAVGAGTTGFVGADPLQLEGEQSAIDLARSMGFDPSTNEFLSGVLGGQPSEVALSTLTDIAGGGRLQNPFLDDFISQEQNNIADLINLRASGLGGLGGTPNQDILSRNLAEAGLGARMRDFDTRSAEQMGASNTLLNMGMQIPGLAAGSFGAGLLGADALRNIGGERRGRSQEELLDEFFQSQRLAGILTPIGGLGGTTTGETQRITPPQAKFNQIAGPALGILGAVGNLALPGAGSVGGALAQQLIPGLGATA